MGMATRLMSAEEWLSMQIEANEGVFGEAGSEIRDSKLYRGYCNTCGEPMRLNKHPQSASGWERLVQDANCREWYLDQQCTRCAAAAHPGWNANRTPQMHEKVMAV